MTLSLRNQRADVYAPSSVTDGGYLLQTYIATGVTYWCRVVRGQSRERTLAGAPIHQDTSLIEFGDEAVIPVNGAVSIEGTTYRIIAQTRRPSLRVTMVEAEALEAPVFPIAQTAAGGTYAADGTLTATGLAP